MATRSVPIPTLAELVPIVGALGLARPRAVTELMGGRNPVFRIDLDGGSAVVLKTYDGRRAQQPAGEAYAAQLLDDLNLPVTRYLTRDETRTRLPYRFAITNYLPGDAVSTFRDDPEIGTVYREMGALLRRLHTVSLPAFGYFTEDGIGEPIADNVIYMERAATHAFGEFRTNGGEPALADQLQRIVRANAGLFAQSRGPVFAHDDFHVGNILATRDADGHLHLSGLIDFGNARAADAVFDLAKSLFMADHDVPGASPYIREGYGPIDHPDPEAALWLYTLMHRVTMWWWLRHVGIIADGQHDPLIDALKAMAEAGGP